MKQKNKKLTTRFLALALCLVTVLTMLPTVKANANSYITYYNARLGIANSNQIVYDDFTTDREKVGTIFAREGFTILENFGGSHIYVEFTTSNGIKRGYILYPDVYINPNSCVAVVNTSSDVYYGQGGSPLYDRAGSVNSGEHVVVLASQDDWDYIEYNTNSGRKRGYIEHSKLTWKNDPLNVLDLPCNEYYPSKEHNVTRATPVYAGPSDIYFNVGTVGTGDNPLYYCWECMVGDSIYAYVEYYVNNTLTKKSGFIKIA